MLTEPPEHTSKQTIVVRLALLFLFGPFIAFFTFAGLNESEHHRAPAPWFGGAATTAIAYVAIWIAIAKTRLTIHTDGMRRDTVFGTRELRWDAVSEYRYRAIPIRVGGHFGLVGALVEAAVSRGEEQKSYKLVVIGAAGKLSITSNVPDAAGVIRTVIDRVHTKLMPELARRMFAGETLRFGKLALSSSELVIGKSRIPLSEITTVELSGYRLRIMRRGKFFAAFGAPMDRVPNLFTFVELLGNAGVSTAVPLPGRFTSPRAAVS